jgi:hypothetical protein
MPPWPPETMSATAGIVRPSAFFHPDRSDARQFLKSFNSSRNLSISATRRGIPKVPIDVVRLVLQPLEITRTDHPARSVQHRQNNLDT